MSTRAVMAAAKPELPRDEIADEMSSLLIGQPDAVEAITPFVHMQRAGLNPAGRPLGAVLMLGPTGTGKTHAVESLAQVLHGNRKNMLKLDCGEYQYGHEVSKLIGAPPGYLGHRETSPRFNQAKIDSVASERSDISIVLFDEIEKGHDSFRNLLLGILDKAMLHLGDGSIVNFERCLIFMTSNLGAKAIQRANGREFGFAAPGRDTSAMAKSAAMSALRRAFSQEFVNRIDAIVSFRPLGRDAFRLILNQTLNEFTRMIIDRLGIRCFALRLTESARELLLDLGTSVEFGARELKRIVQRNLIQPVSLMVSQGLVSPGSTVTLGVSGGKFIIRRS